LQMKRREFLKLSSLTMAAAQLGVAGFSLRAAAAANGKKLFYIFMRGGLDGLFAFPTNDPAFINALKAQRPTIGAPLGDLTVHYPGVLNGLRVHRSLSHLYEDADLRASTLIVPHAGSVNSTRSHFEQMDYIEGGDPQRKLSEGFLARAGAAGSTLAIGGRVPLSLRGADPLLVNSSNMIQDQLVAFNRGQQPARKVAQTNSSFGAGGRLEFLSGLVAACKDTDRVCKTARSAKAKLAAAQTADLNGVGRDPFKLAVRLSKSDLAPQIVTIDLGGFDTHASQVDRLAGDGGLLAALNRGLATMKAELGADWANSVIVIMSEFGRTVAENGTVGTDHGRGGAIIVTGGPVRPARATLPAGRLWRLSESYVEGSGGSLCPAVKHDYRDLLGHVLVAHLGLPVATVFGGVFPGYTRQFDPGFIG